MKIRGKGRSLKKPLEKKREGNTFGVNFWAIEEEKI